MATQTVFKRYEMKYKLTKEQYEALKLAMAEHMTMDKYGRHTIHNIYFDTPDYRLIRRSLEKPAYKEKLRLRSYNDQSNAFIELKKKYDGVVYKRRMELPRKNAMDFLTRGKAPGQSTQIGREIAYFLSHYQDLQPMMYIDYEREAYFATQGGDLRITFDHNLRVANTRATIGEKGLVLLEVKTAMGIPCWLLTFFRQEGIFKTSFSKYGTAYETYELAHHKEGGIHVA